MANSGNNHQTPGDLRASKGAYIFIPAGTKHYLRVEPRPPPVAPFMSQKVLSSLKQSVKSFVETDRFEAKIDPQHGIPERICGTLNGRHENNWILEIGSIRVIVELPHEPKNQSSMLICDMEGPLRAEDIQQLKD